MLLAFYQSVSVEVECDMDHFLCDDHCVPHTWVCNGQVECQDGQDEHGCTGNIMNNTREHQLQTNISDSMNSTCWQNHSTFHCDDRSKCISLNLVCDGTLDCVDGTDELNNCSLVCDKLKCEHYCGINKGQVQCFCHKGFEINPANKSSCIDIDECELPGDQHVCSQLCHNVQGSFYCTCHRGYNYKKDSNKCKSEGIEPVIVYATHDEIGTFRLKKFSHDKLLEHLHGVISIDVDVASKKIFWLEVNNKQPGVYYLDMSHPFRYKSPLVTFGLFQPHSLGFDYFGRNLYVTDPGKPAILACKPELMTCVRVFDKTAVSHPTDIALHPQEGFIYWVESNKSQIIRGSMDGSSSSVFLSLNLIRPFSLHIDMTTEKLYWIDGLHSVIQSVHLDGSNRRTVIGHLPHPMLLFTFEDDIYWTNKDSPSLLAADKFSGHDVRTILPNIRQLTDMVFNHPSLQIDNADTNKCKANTCSHFCLVGLNDSFKCACPDGFKLDADLKNCTSIHTATLFAAHKNKLIKIPVKLAGVMEVVSLKTESMRNVLHLAYLAKSNEILYTDLTKEGKTTINLLSNIGTKPKSQVVLMDAGNVNSLVVDESSSVIYWVDTNTHQVHLSSLDGVKRLTLMIEHVDHPHALAVEPSLGLMFVADHSHPSIVSCYQDGTFCVILISNIQTPDFLFFYDTQLCFSNNQSQDISCINLDGSHYNKLSVVNSKPTSLAVYEKQLFWTDLNSDFVHCQQLEQYSVSPCKIETEKFNMTGLIVAVNTVITNSSCSVNNGGCDHICVPLPHNISCLCSDGYVLQLDLKSCVKYNDHRNLCEGFLCHNNISCIPVSSQCDRHPDCPDASDELKCTEFATCENQSYMCGNGRCISQTLFCDGEDDCGDNSDEEGELCPGHHCFEGEYKCSSNRCLQANALCDGVKDCHDGSDEASCSAVPDHCKQSELACSIKCITADAICDGYNDCMNGEDETNCSQSHCTVDQHHCLDGQCVNKTVICDHVHDCSDGDDEVNCEEGITTSHIECHGFKCQNGHCIETNKVCDGILHCTDESDESNCTVSCKTFNPCSQICIESRVGPTCMCHKGFQLIGKTLCEDVDECSDHNGGCSQKCLNKKGSHQCWCHTGFTLGMDQRGCKANGSRPFLIVGTHLGVTNVSLTSKQNRLSIATSSLPNHLDINTHTNEIYWTEYEFQKMTLVSSKGRKWKTQSEIFDIAVDWITNNVYITEVYENEGRIKVFGSKYHKTLIAKKDFAPRDIVLHPNTSMMFWLSLNEVDKIERSWMDGLQRTVVVQLISEGRPMALTIDHPAERLYWLYGNTGVLETCKLDGTQKFSVAYHLSHTVNSLDIFEGLAYMTDGTDDSIITLNTYNPMNYEPKIRTQLRLGPVKVVHRLKQPTRLNTCQDLNCMFLCVLIPYGGRCLCRDEYHDPTNIRCEGQTDEMFNKLDNCSVHCQNGGYCIALTNFESCSCPTGYSGKLCETNIGHLTGATVGNSLSWLVGLLVTIIVVVLIITGVVFVMRYRRKTKLLVSTIRFKDAKFTKGKCDDEEGLVQEISFNETCSLEESFKMPVETHFDGNSKV
ncbi:hypothetical protein Btru_004214 [Bulinus truncatus]|nr:hypothetical protein Btru_004214 [Bulinus truncatus]